MLNSNAIKAVFGVPSSILMSIAMTVNAYASSRVDFSATSPGLVIGPDYISQQFQGVTIKAQGFTVEFDTTNGASFIYGPYPTGVGIFGPSPRGIPEPGFGLVSQPLPGIDVTGVDRGGGAISAGFDNGVNGSYLGDNPNIPGPPRPKIEFALFTFSSPVDISQVIVDDVVNSGRSIWAAGGATAPNLSGGLLSAFPGFLLKSSFDDASDGEFIHQLTGFSGISYLAVGVPTPATVGQYGLFPANQGFNEWYMVGLGLDIAAAVPEPSTAVLIGAGLLCLFTRRARYANRNPSAGKVV